MRNRRCAGCLSIGNAADAGSPAILSRSWYDTEHTAGKSLGTLTLIAHLHGAAF
jgi:hypothetical protein